MRTDVRRGVFSQKFIYMVKSIKYKYRLPVNSEANRGK